MQKYAAFRPLMSVIGRGRSTVALTSISAGTSARTASYLPGRSGLRHRDDDEVGEKQAKVDLGIPPQLRALVPADDDDRPIGGDWRQRCSAAVEDHEIEGEFGRHPRALEHVRDETAPASPPPHRLQPTVSTPATAAVSR